MIKCLYSIFTHYGFFHKKIKVECKYLNTSQIKDYCNGYLHYTSSGQYICPSIKTLKFKIIDKDLEKKIEENLGDILNGTTNS